MLKIKICCINSIEEAHLALDAGATALGLVGPMPSGPGVIPMELICEIAQAMKGQAETFFLTCETTAAAILAQHKHVQTSTIQLTDALEDGQLEILQSALPEVQIVQVVHVEGEHSLDFARNAALHADALLLDSGNTGLEVKQLGGTGRTHNWDISRAIVEAVEVPVFLAGGLKPENVQMAIQTVGPHGVDVCSGVRTGGILDEKKLEEFVAAIRTMQ